MKKQLFFLAVAALALASCSSENDVVQTPAAQQTVADDAAVDFDVYIGRGLTRGGVNGPITTELLKGTPANNDAYQAGFGVFGYYTDGEPYSAITKPNFFYNQQVKYVDPVWTYTPLKYWPNEFGGDAASDQVDRVTLFAYLPYVEVDPLTGVTKAAASTAPDKEKKAKDPTTNITGMTRNTSTGDPFIKYVATMDPTNSVDLCYGVAAENFTSSNSAINKNEIEKGKPYIDVKKPGTDANSKIKFDFKHATAQLIVTINANVTDLTSTSNSDEVQTDYTRIWVRSVTFTGITQKGSLNLNSTAGSPEWYDLNGNSKITTGSLTVYDGRKDGKEANDAASNESPASLNTQIVQSKQYTVDDDGKITNELTETGVVKTPCNLFMGDNGKPVFVIPTKEKMRVTIVYDVETVDKNLPYFLSDGKTPGSSIQNTIYKDIDTFGEIEAGYCYTLNLHLGMRTVDFDAEVTAWQDMQADVDLPSNLQTFAATSPANSGTVNLAASATTYEFAISGLKPNDMPAKPSDLLNGGGEFTMHAANGSGVAKVEIASITENKSTKKIDKGARYISSPTTGAAVNIHFWQNPHKLGLAFDHWDSSSSNVKIYLTTESSTGLTDDLTKDAAHIKVWKNSVELAYSTDFEYANGVITLKTDSAKPETGDSYKVYIQSGDAPAETVTFNRLP